MKETLRRAARTFLQAAVGYLATNFVYVISSETADIDYFKQALLGVCVSAVAAGLAAVMNLPKATNQQENTQGKEDAE